MARVPDYSGRQVQSQGVAANGFSMRGPDASGLTRGLAQAEDGVMRLMREEKEKADTAALMDAERQLSEWKFSTMFGDSGVYTRKGKNALDVTNATVPEFDKKAGELEKLLTNEQQRNRWKAITGSQRQSLLGELNRYEFGERQTYYDDVDRGQLEAAQQGAILYANDPQQVAYYQNKMNAVLGAQAQRKGLPAELAEQNRLEANSKLSAAVVTSLMQTDPYKAQQYFAQALPSMTAQDQASINKMLGGAVRKRMADGIVDALWNDGSTGGDGLVAALIQNESGGNPDAVSSKGARGLMQLMPDTAREVAGELGLPYDEQRLTSDPNYNMTLGKAYLQKMLQRYDGNEALAVAAYNAGPGSVDEWLKTHGDPRTGQVSVADWVNRIPFAETRAYTAKVLSDTARRQPASVKYSDGLQAINQIADPELRELARDRLDDFHKAEKARTDAIYDQAAQVVNDQGFNELPPEVTNQLSADDLGKLRKLDRQRREGVEPVTDYKRLEGFLSMAPEKLAELSLERDIRPYLDNGDFGTVRGAWQKARNGDGSGQKVAKAEQDALNRVMNMAGIQTGDNKDARATNNLQRQQQFKAAYQARVEAATLKTGTPPTLAEKELLAEQLLLDVKLRNTGWSDDSAKLWEVMPEQLQDAYLDKGDVSVSQIPPSERLEIVNALRATGRVASEANIIAEYVNRISSLGVNVR